jgi:hypothetical protein
MSTTIGADAVLISLNGEGEEGETDAHGPWKQGGDWQSSKLPNLKRTLKIWETSQSEDSGRVRDSAQARRSLEPENQRSI